MDNYTVILVGGISRSGKTTLARRLRDATGFPHLELDYLFNGVDFALNRYPLAAGGEVTAADFTAEIVHGLVRKLAFMRESYIVEGTWVRPETIRRLFDEFPRHDIRCTLLGYATAEIEEKREVLMACVARDKRDWINRLSLEEVDTFLERQISKSACCRDQCENLGLTYLDTSDQFDLTLEAAFERLISAPARSVRESGRP